MTKSKRFQFFEIGLYIFTALIVFLIPLAIHYEEGDDWGFVYKDWLRLIPFFAVFLVNNFLLTPKLLLKGKYGLYVLSCAALIVAAVFLNNITDRHPANIRKNNQNAPSEMVMRNHAKHQPNTHPERTSPPEAMPNPKNNNPHFNAPPKDGPPPFFKFGTFIISFLIIGFNSGIKIFVRWANEQDERSEKERQYLTTELAFLKHQISPHFFMNTLNNIHALIDIDTERAKDAIIKLSRLMRYLLYESDIHRAPLKKEIEFLESYIELMRLRYDENKLTINLSFSGNSDRIIVPSLLFLPLVENAFKHGVDARLKSFVDIEFDISEDKLTFSVRNSLVPKTTSQFDEKSGIGLENLRKRLEIIYKKNYHLSMKSENNIFEVLLTIPVA